MELTLCIDDEHLVASVARLRKKLEVGLKDFIETKKGVGCRVASWWVSVNLSNTILGSVLPFILICSLQSSWRVYWSAHENEPRLAVPSCQMHES